MTLPDERYRAVVQTRRFLFELCNPTRTPRVPKIVRDTARDMIRHYPNEWDMRMVSKGHGTTVFQKQIEPVTKLFKQYEQSKEKKMRRAYENGVKDDVIFFIGTEVEHTPAFGMRTLFVTGIQNVSEIKDILDDENCKLDTNQHIKHIFFGANHSFDPVGYDEHKLWEEMIMQFLTKDYLCSLDIPMNQVEEFNEGGLNDYLNFIPQIRVPIPYIKLWNYNTMLKIDDKGFKATNPGVWTHSLHNLKDRSKFTPWTDYNNDEIIK